MKMSIEDKVEKLVTEVKENHFKYLESLPSDILWRHCKESIISLNSDVTKYSVFLKIFVLSKGLPEIVFLMENKLNWKMMDLEQIGENKTRITFTVNTFNLLSSTLGI